MRNSLLLAICQGLDEKGVALKFLLTGGAGFVGSHLLDQLINQGNSVIILDDFSTGSKENIAHHIQNKAVEVFEGSILDADLVDKLVSKSDRVLHLAAAVGVFNIVNHPLKSLSTNVKGSENIFDACLKHNKPVLITSSSEVYGKNTSDLLSEDSDRVVGAPQKIRWSYSDAKAIDEAMAIALHQQRGLESRIVRLFNTVGPRQVGSYGMVVPRFVEAALKNQPLTIFGNGNQTRCFTHVHDAINAIIKIETCANAIGRPVNIGVNQEVSISNLANMVIRALDSSSTILYQAYDEAYPRGFEDMERRVPDNKLLHELTGWIPEKNLMQIITETAQYLVSKKI